MSECTFYSKVGTCRHGEKCSKVHLKPKYSKIVKISNMYTGGDLEDFVVDLFTEASKFAPIDEFLIAGNDSEHLKGTVYITLNNEKGAEKLVDNFEKRWYNEMPLYCSLSPIKDLWSACCRDPETCSRGGDCNYLHPIAIPSSIVEPLFLTQKRPQRDSRQRPPARDFDGHKRSSERSRFASSSPRRYREENPASAY